MSRSLPWRSGLAEHFSDHHLTHLKSIFPEQVFSEYLRDFHLPRLRHVSLRPGLSLKDWQDELPGIQVLPEGLFFPDTTVFAHCPGYHAGIYYPQELSAASVTDLVPEDLSSAVDLCAAPGGKSWRLHGRIAGWVWSNEPVGKRFRVLSSNLERGGFKNRVLSQADPGHLMKLGLMADLVLVDAPCSGEGLFRRNPNSILEWSRDAIEHCVRRQRDILDAAAAMVYPGGYLLYSTCTFNRQENEGQREHFLETHTEFTLIQEQRWWPDARHEGHYACLLQRSGALSIKPPEITQSQGYLVATDLAKQQYLRDRCVLEPGVRIKDGDEVSYGFARTLRPGEFEREITIERSSVLAWFRGETFPTTGKKGLIAVFWNDCCLGIGRDNGLRIQNLVPKGIRTYVPRS